MINVPPNAGGWVEEKRNQPFSWRLAISELIDNSFDADAKRVIVEFSAGTLIVQDDGSGIKDVAGMWTYAMHIPGHNTKLGHYGVGLKDTALWCSDRTTIITVHNGKKTVHVVDWPAFAKSGVWEMNDPIVKDCADPNGTTLIFTLRKDRRAADIGKLANELGITFMPALLDGKQIILRKGNTEIICKAYVFPEMTDVVEERFNVNGKEVKLRAGIVREYERNSHSGLMVLYAFRVIREDPAFGARGKGTGSIAGTLQLGKGWRLSKNKTEISDPDLEALEDAVYKRMEPLLEKAGTATREVSHFALNSRIAGILDETFAEIGREKRASPTKPGPHPPGPNPPKIRERIGPGLPKLVRQKRSAAGYAIAWYYKEDKNFLGEATITKRLVTVTFNENFDNAAHFRDRDDANMLAVLAFHIIGRAFAENPQMSLFKKDSGKFADTFSRLLAGFKPLDKLRRVSDLNGRPQSPLEP